MQGFVLEPVFDAFAHRDLLAQLEVGVGQLAGAGGDALFQLGIGLAQAFVGVAAFQRAGDVQRDETEQFFVALAVQVIRGVALHRDQAHHLAGDLQGHAEPAHRFGAGGAYFAGRFQSIDASAVDQQGAAVAQHVFGQAVAEHAPLQAAVAFVDRIREFQLLAVIGEQGDVEIACVQQLADDLVHAGVEGVDAGAAAGDFGDAEQGALQALALFAHLHFVAQLAGAFLHALFQARLRIAPRQRVKDVLADVVEQGLVVLAVAHGRVVALHHHGAAHHAVLKQGHAEPVLAVRAEAVVAVDVVLFAQLRRRAAQRLAVADHRQGQAVAEFAAGDFLVRVGNVGVVAVGEIDEAQGVVGAVVAGDVEILRVHQPTNDQVQAVQHVGHALVGTGEVADGEQGALQALGIGQALHVHLQALRVQQRLRAQRQRRQRLLPIGSGAPRRITADQHGPEAGVLRQQLGAPDAAIGQAFLGHAAFAAGAVEQGALRCAERLATRGMQLSGVAGLVVPDQLDVLQAEAFEFLQGHHRQRLHVAGAE